MPKEGGLDFDMYHHPFDVDDMQKWLETHTWPDPVDPGRFEGVRERAWRARQKEKLVVLNGLCAGIVEVCSWLRGYPRFYVDLGQEVMP